jgi:hypothetical protein
VAGGVWCPGSLPGKGAYLHTRGLGPDFAKMWTANAVSNLGDGVTLVAGPLLAATLTRDRGWSPAWPSPSGSPGCCSHWSAGHWSTGWTAAG